MKFRIFALSLCLPFVLCAKPVSIDEIFTPKKQFKILGSFSYLNVMRKNSAPALISIPSSIHGLPKYYRVCYYSFLESRKCQSRLLELLSSGTIWRYQTRRGF
ncbi:hypothetical protein [Helicobacter japonicus]|uniref:hypothetical protein n=1 Tax=Helicobacter japonicus TaxID=425400 RepID=UPI0023F1F9FF|nr:hypothetical protein [Helicobacter japonicus]